MFTFHLFVLLNWHGEAKRELALVTQLNVGRFSLLLIMTLPQAACKNRAYTFCSWGIKIHRDPRYRPAKRRDVTQSRFLGKKPPYSNCIRQSGLLIVVHRVEPSLFFPRFFETQCHSRPRYRHTPAGWKKKGKCGTYILYGRQLEEGKRGMERESNGKFLRGSTKAVWFPKEEINRTRESAIVFGVKSKPLQRRDCADSNFFFFFLRAVYFFPFYPRSARLVVL